MAYDTTRARVVLFGGINTNGFYANDTWEWDGAQWTSFAVSGPSGRSGHAMAYDRARGRTVLFGGFGFYGDTWEWNGSTWQQVASSGGSSPSGRYGHTLAYDASLGRIVMFGGQANFALLNDTWEWDGISWSQRPTQSYPPPRLYHCMAYDTTRQRTLLFSGASNNYFGDTWEYDGRFLAEAAPYGAGCGTPPLALDSPTTSRPVIGTTAQAVLQNTPSSFAFMALGWSDQSSGGLPLPLSLAGYGMPGCDLLQSGDVLALSMTAGSGNVSTYSLQIPNQVVLINATLYLQAWAFAPGANPGSRLVSNGLRWRVGNS